MDIKCFVVNVGDIPFKKKIDFFLILVIPQQKKILYLISFHLGIFVNIILITFLNLKNEHDFL